MLMNQLNYTEGGLSGSLRDYFLANSYGQCEVHVDVFGPYMMPNSIDAYDNNSYSGNSKEMARLAVTKASEDGCDFSVYANDAGLVESFHIIFAGYGQEAGAPVGKSIWSHAWNLSSVLC